MYTYKDKQYKVNFVEKSELYPFFGMAYMKLGYAKVRKDLHPLVKEFVTQHELYHLRDTKKWGGVLGREIRASIVPGLKNPLGLMACILVSLFSKERRALYKDRIKRKY